MKKIIILLLLAFSFSSQAMTREEVKQEFLNSSYLIGLSNAMDYIKDQYSEPKPLAAFEELMDRAFQDTTLTAQYMAEMQSGEFSAVIIERFGVYLRNCLRADLANLVGQPLNTVVFEP